jgi:hypothetical protein
VYKHAKPSFYLCCCCEWFLSARIPNKSAEIRSALESLTLVAAGTGIARQPLENTRGSIWHRRRVESLTMMSQKSRKKSEKMGKDSPSSLSLDCCMLFII